MTKNTSIIIKGARVNNLKNIDVEIPRNRLVVITGLSGSGKSSLAFDTLYAEGQRRYVESLSSYARQFLGRMSKPECDFIKGIPPCYCHRTEGKQPQPALHSGNLHRNLRIPAFALCPGGTDIQPGQRSGGKEALHRRHCELHAPAARRNTLHRTRSDIAPRGTHLAAATGDRYETGIQPAGSKRRNGAH